MTTASEKDILKTLEFLWTRLKIVVEPSSAVALAPLFTGKYASNSRRVGVILSGGNVDVSAFFKTENVNMEESFGRDRHQASEVEAIEPSPKKTAVPKVLVCTAVDDAALNELKEMAEVDVRPHLKSDELISQIAQYQALIVGPRTAITDQMIEYGFNLKAIGVISSRLDNVDVSTARDMGITLCHTTTGNAVAIAEHTLSRLLMLANQCGDGRLAGKTLGLIGFGRIGQQVAQRARAFDMNVIVNQPRLTPELAMSAGVKATDLIALLRQSDFISLHVPFKKETQAIISAPELSQMKPGACLINTGHTDLVNESALLAALENGRVAGAALSNPPDKTNMTEVAKKIRQHSCVVVWPHVSAIIGSQRRDMALQVTTQIAQVLTRKQADEALSLELVPIDQVVPHEQIDDKRVARLMGRLENDGRLVNPPVTTFWNGRYIILDGATRFTAFKRLGYPHVIVQVVPPGQAGFELHTWYHVISSRRPFVQLLEELKSIPQLIFRTGTLEQAQSLLGSGKSICFFLDNKGGITLVQVQPGSDQLQGINQLVASYTKWGNVERTLVTDLPRLRGQYPDMTAVAVFPQFKPETVFNVASLGKLLPAGLTRFVIPGRILRLNAELSRLKSNESLPAKRAWFNRFLEEKLARSRLRYYEEPVILLDE